MLGVFVLDFGMNVQGTIINKSIFTLVANMEIKHIIILEGLASSVLNCNAYIFQAIRKFAPYLWFIL